MTARSGKDSRRLCSALKWRPGPGGNLIPLTLSRILGQPNRYGECAATKYLARQVLEAGERIFHVGSDRIGVDAFPAQARRLALDG